MLRESILEHGCLTPLVVWNGVLVDGYNRYSICMEHDIPFETVSRDFRSRYEALIWMTSNQIARRNLTPLQLSRYRGMHYRADRRLHGDSSRFSQGSDEEQPDDLVFRYTVAFSLPDRERRPDCRTAAIYGVDFFCVKCN